MCSACVATESSVVLAIHLDQHPLSFYSPATMPRGKPYSDNLCAALVNMARHLDIDSIICYTGCSRVLSALLADYRRNGMAIWNIWVEILEGERESLVDDVRGSPRTQ